MSTIVEERAGEPAGERWSLERLLAMRPQLTWETGALGVIFLVGFALRFWDLGPRAIHHDESLHATYSWYLYKGRGYIHDPLMHGPLLFHLMALVYLLFGVSDATARFVPAAFGAGMVLLPLLLRPWLGRAGTIAAAGLIAVSPTLLYFSRFVGAGGQDIIVAVAMLMIAAGVWQYLRTGEPRWIYLLAAGLAVGFTTKEVTYMMAALLVLYLNGVTAAELAAQVAVGRGWSPARRRLVAVALMPVAWALALFWPWLGRQRERWGLTELPRAAGALIVAGTLSAPMFSAAVQVPLEKLGVDMAGRAPIMNWTNERFWGTVIIGALIGLGVYFGTAWRRREWLIAAAIYWGISIPLFTTFFTNTEGVATGIWGSLDYWLEQQDVHRGAQPVFYYLVLTPVYEYLTLVLALAGIVCAAVRGGRDTAIALVVGLAGCLAAAVLGDGAHGSLPYALVALAALTYAMRAYAFRQFVVFWLGAMLLGLSVAGEKMPWLEVHLALPLALLAALTIDEAFQAVRGRELVTWLPKVSPLLGLGLAAALLAWASNRFAAAPWLLGGVLLAAAALAVMLAVRRQPVAAAAATALVLGFLGPLTVRTGVVAAFENGDIPVEMEVYTQTTPELVRIKDRIDQYAKESGLGPDVPIIVDSTEAFTWPWAWYLRDYKRVIFPDLSSYHTNPTLIASLQPGSVLLAQLSNAGVGAARPDIYAPGERYKHRWWFPEEGYRATTTSRFFEWVRDPDMWKTWLSYIVHRELTLELGSIDAVAYFPAGWAPAAGPGTSPAAQQQPPAAEPRLEPDGRLIVGAPGAGRGQLQRPTGLAVDQSGNVYVADSLNNRVQKFDAEGRLVAVVGSPGQFREPWGVAVDREGNVYVADTWNHRIHKLNRDMQPVKTWGGPPQALVPNPPPLELYGPRAIAVDGDGNLWVTDTGHSRLVKYSPDGQPLGSFGTKGTGPGQFQEPVGVTVAVNGDILVADTWNGRVQRFDGSFTYKGELKVDGWSDRNVENKPYLTTDLDGTVYVTVPDAGQVLRYSPDGRPLGPLPGLDVTAGARPRPLGIALAAGKLWLADAAAGRLIRLPAK